MGGGVDVESDVVRTVQRLNQESGEVHGNTFSSIPVSGANVDPRAGQPITRVWALEERIAAEIAFRRVLIPDVVRYVKNQSLGFTILYNLGGRPKRYIPDSIVCIVDGHGPDSLLNLIVEVTGEGCREKTAKVKVACNLWVPVVNNHGELRGGRSSRSLTRGALTMPSEESSKPEPTLDTHTPRSRSLTFVRKKTSKKGPVPVDATGYGLLPGD